MKNFLFVSIILLPFTSLGQNNLILQKTGKTIQEIIPKGWEVLDSVKGDLNSDGLSDLVFAIQKTNSRTDKLYHENDDIVNLNPRILGIYFKTKNNYLEQQLVSEDFIIQCNSVFMDEPFEGFAINENGTLEIIFRFWYSSGSWWVSNYKYCFLYQNQSFELICFESNELHRSSGETIEINVDFINEEIETIKSNFSTDSPESLEVKDFDSQEMLTIRSLKKPFELDFEGMKL